MSIISKTCLLLRQQRVDEQQKQPEPGKHARGKQAGSPGPPKEAQVRRTSEARSDLSA